MNEIMLNKTDSVQRCIRRAREIYTANQTDFLTNYNAQDAAILNILRACELSIDLANQYIKLHKLGLPKNSADSFELLAQHDIIPQDLAKRLMNMVGFRNISVHNYKAIDCQIVINILHDGLDDLIAFTEKML